jgi:hypothetical protein
MRHELYILGFNAAWTGGGIKPVKFRFKCMHQIEEFRLWCRMSSQGITVYLWFILIC